LAQEAKKDEEKYTRVDSEGVQNNQKPQKNFSKLKLSQTKRA
jgi:hypothetical protein